MGTDVMKAIDVSSVNVQAKWAGNEDGWLDYGDVTLASAAQEMVRDYDGPDHGVIEADDPWFVHVRYENKPGTVWTVEVTKRVSYDATPLRCDGE